MDHKQHSMEYNFKKFEGQNSRNENRITITRSNSIGFPTKFYNDNRVNDYKFAVLYYDEGNRAIAIELTNSETEKNKFGVIHNKNNLGGGIAVRSFFRSNNINPTEVYGRYEWKKDQINGNDVFIIHLKEHEKTS